MVNFRIPKDFVSMAAEIFDTPAPILQAIARAATMKPPRMQDLLVVLDVLKTRDALKYIPQAIGICLPLIDVSDPELTAPETSGKIRPQCGRYLIGLMGLTMVMEHAQRDRSIITPSLMRRINDKLDDIFKAIDYGLTWAQSARDDEAVPYPHLQPSGFPTPAALLLCLLNSFDPAALGTFIAHPSTIRLVIRFWLLKNVSKQGMRFAKGPADEYICYIFKDSVYLCPYINLWSYFFRREQDDRFWEGWVAYCKENNLDGDVLLADTIVSRLRTIRRCTRDPEVDVYALWLNARPFVNMIRYLGEASQRAMGWDPDVYPGLKIPVTSMELALMRRTFLPEVIHIFNDLNDRCDAKAIASYPEIMEKAPPAVQGANIAVRAFIFLIQSTHRGAYVIPHVLSVVKAGIVPLFVKALYTLLDYPIDNPEFFGIEHQYLDLWESVGSMMVYLTSYSAYPSIVAAMKESLEAIPDSMLEAVSKRLASHPCGKYKKGLQLFLEMVNEWHACMLDYRRVKDKLGLMICDNPAEQDWNHGHRVECRLDANLRRERELDESWYTHNWRSWHIFLILWTYRTKALFHEHLRRPADSILSLVNNIYPTMMTFFPPGCYLMEGISHSSDIPQKDSLEARLAAMLKAAGDQAEREEQSEYLFDIPFPRIRLVEGLFMFGQCAVSVMLQVKITGVREEGAEVDLEVMQTLTRIGPITAERIREYMEGDNFPEEF
ncbi:hypothetical protein CC1G_08718 [Coprinopsis cinerea okayama7|uniref:Uncharacterized protein n=1 Tax=Coprinopsis cinerea (strain Okayama-7 / 130 / ATCC MYA-4618 / FGSC 9003) TaxID=240176 RepID=A8NIW6_COPC7|nr:hypothetical protein CC1G_08718 [Coprinopsis cinerea okayama7\|eukprot:XP_001834087.1 hypothetical protein CC1G_08718 [Coprinopsis cinerea okayama7\